MVARYHAYEAELEREKSRAAKDAEEYKQALAEGRVTTYNASTGHWEPKMPQGQPAAPNILYDERYWEFYNSLRGQGSDHESAYGRAVNRAEQEAEMRAAGFVSTRTHPAQKPYSPRKAVNDNEKPTRIRATPFVLVDPTTLERREWILGKFAMRQEISFTVAPGGVGKTAFSHVEGIALASGRNLLGVDVPEPLRVWIWNGEEPAKEMARRIGAICLHYDVTARDLGGRLFLDTEDDVKLVLCAQERNVAEIKVPVVDALVSELKAREIDFMIVDPFVSTHRCTENDNNAMHEAASAWKTVAKQANCAIHLVHHTRKSGGQAITAESLRGGDAISSKARAVRPLNPLNTKEAITMGLTRQEGASIFYYDPSGNKVNMTRRGGGLEFYKIVNVPLYNQVVGDLDVGDEMGVVTRWTPPEVAASSIDVNALADFKAELASGFFPCSPQSHENEAWVGRLIARCFDVAVDDHGAWKTRVKAIWKQLVASGEVVEATELDDQSRSKKVGRPAPQTSDCPASVEPEEGD